MKNVVLKKILVVLSCLLFQISANATELEKIEYKNLKDGTKLIYDGVNWSNKVSRKATDYYIKKIPNGITEFSEFYNPEGIFLFSTATQYEFVNKGSLIGYSNNDLKFYDIFINNGIVETRELLADEVQALFPKYKVIKISNFSKATNSLKIKKKRGNLKIILLNDTDMIFDNYSFTSNNAEYKFYELKGFLEITKKGMIQFSKFGDNTRYSPWFILLLR